MSGSDASTGWPMHEARRPVPRSRYGDMRFGSSYVAETDSNRPAHFARLLRFLMHKGSSREDAEDLIQEAMLRLHVYANNNAVENKEAFLRHVIHNLAIDRYRRDRLGLHYDEPIEELDRRSPLIAPGPTPDQIVDSQQRLDEITALLDAANPRTREIYLAHISGYTYAEIADYLGIAEMTIKRHVARARMTIMSLANRNRDTRSEKRS